ncbi:MAG: hypothetical protein IKK39_04120, partial [Thermoguttaceae bacterium]|nr:hypothetical protein [Thermoguttaceae bacterium]
MKNNETQNNKKDKKTSSIIKMSTGGSANRFWNPRMWDGVTIPAWLKILNTGRWRIAPTRFPMFCIISGLAVTNSFLAGWQKLTRGKKIRDAQLVDA